MAKRRRGVGGAGAVLAGLSSIGCLGILIVVSALSTAYDKCSGAGERREAERQLREKEARQEAQRRDYELFLQRQKDYEREQERAAAALREEVARLAKLKPDERAGLLTKCVADAICPSSEYHLLQSAASPAERRTLEAKASRLRRERERQAQARHDAWANAPLECRDGTLSPTCTCGGRKNYRGCCSGHHGVRGCSVSPTSR